MAGNFLNPSQRPFMGATPYRMLREQVLPFAFGRHLLSKSPWQASSITGQQTPIRFIQKKRLLVSGRTGSDSWSTI